MGLRIATISDFEEIQKYAYNFIEASPYRSQIDKEVVDLTIRSMLQPFSTSVIFLHEGKGFIAATLNRFIYGTFFNVTELAWWVEPEARRQGVGRELIKALEEWAKERDAKFVCLMDLDGSLKDFYESEKYILSERTYFKEI